MRVPCLLGLVLGLGAASAAHAQQMPPDDRNIDIQLFEPAIGTGSFLTVSSADTMSRGQFTLSLGMTYLTQPLSVYFVDQSNGDMLESRADVVSSVFAGNLSGAYAIFDNLQAGAYLPIIFSLRGDGLDAQTGQPEAGGISATGLGDLRLEATWRFYEKGPLALAVVPAVTLPTSQIGSKSDAFLGDDVPSFRPRVAATLALLDAKLSVGANLGLILRKLHTLYSSEVGQQLTYGAAAAYRVVERLDVIAEVFGRKGFNGDLDGSPLEIDGGLRLRPGAQLAVLAGVGTGVVRGVGVPAFRVFAAVAWQPDFRDSDGDGIDNMRDRCPAEAEDKDGFQDDDGCPEADNDGDFIEDALDKCPTEKEDADGFMDEDGCPDLDNDKDGIPDDKDACPNEAEDKQPPRADDGCPRTSAAAPDVTPEAPPTEPPPPATTHVLQAPLEFDGTRIRTSARPSLDQAAAAMKARAEVKRWRVTVAVDKGKDAKKQQRLADGQARAVKAYLARKGVAATIEVVGVVADAPRVTIAPAEGAPPAEPQEPVIEIQPEP